MALISYHAYMELKERLRKEAHDQLVRAGILKPEGEE